MIGIEVFGGIEKNNKRKNSHNERNAKITMRYQEMDHMIAMAHYTGIKMQIFVMRI